MRVLALDIGEKRVGVACGDTCTLVALPLQVVDAQLVESYSGTFKRLVEDHEPEAFVVGLPKSLDGTEGMQAQRIRKVVQNLRQKLRIPVYFVDERLSSAQAKRFMRDQGFSEKQMRGKLDCVAASLFLQAWFDSLVTGTEELYEP
ncbi:MAG: Holliday junction resolvase RuvX [Coriobacteriales bacterium]|nr:Holliday junction resolvase RuvX [Coriobacteriales bacterium]